MGLAEWPPIGAAEGKGDPAPDHLTADELMVRADAARDARDHREAARLYDAAARLRPDNAAIHVQSGHMLKEAGDFAGAEARYLEASRLTPDDSDLALQLGHFYKIAGRIEESGAAYERSLELRPGWSEPIRELAFLHRRYGRARPDAAGADPGTADETDRLAPELLPRLPAGQRRSWAEAVYIGRLGARLERSRWGTMNTLRGVEAIRGFCVSSTPLLELRIALDGQVVHLGALQAADPGQVPCRYVFNAWIDVSRLAPGPYQAELHFSGAEGEERVHRESVVVMPPLSEAEHPDSDAVVELAGSDPRTIEQQINARPSMVRPAERGLFADPVRSVLVVRADQLGDMVVSVPGLRRLRELLPASRLVGLLTPANAEFAATLGLFDEIVVVDFPLDAEEDRRVMPLRAQEALRAKLAPYRFDVALDFSESHESRPLLLLSGARFLYGFHAADFPWLDGGFEGSTHDRKTYSEAAPQSTKLVALVERLGASLDSRAQVVRRPDLTREMLAPYGLAGGEPYAVLHGGARLAANRWPHYGELAALLLRNTALKLVLLTDAPAAWPDLPEVAGDGRVQCIDRRLPFEQFDALVSFCTLFVGNDSGPKHLASLRGANVVSLHSARINWKEWGQEIGGRIISRRVPCAGCGITRGEECGKDFACIVHISPDEVFEAAAALLGHPVDATPGANAAP